MMLYPPMPIWWTRSQPLPSGEPGGPPGPGHCRRGGGVRRGLRRKAVSEAINEVYNGELVYTGTGDAFSQSESAEE